MSDRTFSVKVTGFTPAGFQISFETHEVPGKNIPVTVDWIDKTLTGCSLKGALVTKRNGDSTNEDGEETRTCPIHHVEMYRHTKGTASWYSHKVTAPDGSEVWCRGK